MKNRPRSLAIEEGSIVAGELEPLRRPLLHNPSACFEDFTQPTEESLAFRPQSMDGLERTSLC